MDNVFTGTSSTPEPIKLSLADLSSISKRFQSEYQEILINNFKGIPVRVDKSLKDFQYYICVSPELKDLLEKRYGPNQPRESDIEKIEWPENEIIREDKAE